MFYLIKSNTGQIILSNIENENLQNQIVNCKLGFERVYCKIENKQRRQGLIVHNSLTIYIASYDESLTNKIFKHKMEGISIFSKLIDLELTNAKTQESQKTRRLKHNLINHNSNILQELYKLVPQDSLRAGNNHLELIEEFLVKDSRKAAYTYLRILKSSNLMKAEFEVYDMLNTSEPYLDFTDHQIHKVLILTLNPFWLDFAEIKVSINIQPFLEKVHIDYRSISVVLSHIFDNATKYLMPHSDFNISFDSDLKEVSIYIKMISLKVESHEVSKIFEESNSGKWANKLELSGDGIGMYLVRKLVHLNKGTVTFHANYKNHDTIMFNNAPFEHNMIVIKLKKK